jgi:hypothetical protein
MRVPDFLVRQFYVGGSLQPEGAGFRLQARNGMGDGTLVGIKGVSVDGAAIDLADITATVSGGDTVHQAADISRAAPVAFTRGDVVTFHFAGPRLAAGKHAFEVEVYEVNLGLVTLALSDKITAT